MEQQPMKSPHDDSGSREAWKFLKLHADYMLVQDAVFFCNQATSVGEQAGATSKQQTQFVLCTRHFL